MEATAQRAQERLNRSLAARLLDHEARLARLEARLRAAAGPAPPPRVLCPLQPACPAATGSGDGSMAIDVIDVAIRKDSVIKDARELRETFFGDHQAEMFKTWRMPESVWDISMLIGHPKIGIGSSILAGALLILNVWMQLSFVLVAGNNFGDISFPESVREALHGFRTSVAHDVAFLDSMTKQTLASRVCSGDPSLHLAAYQSETIRVVDNYLNIGAPFNGPLMCLMSELVWIITVCKELEIVSDQWRAVRVIPKPVKRQSPTGDDCYLDMTTCHRFNMMGIVFLRLAIAGLLLVIGVQWLAYTVSVQELILNAVKLELILNVDEIIYKGLAPLSVRVFLGRMKPIRLPRTRLLGNLDARSVSLTLGSIIGLGVVVLFFLIPQIDNILEAQEFLCGGNQDFVYTVPTIGNLVWAPVVPVPWEQTHSLGLYKLTRGLIERPRDEIASDSIVQFYRVRSAVGGMWSVATQAKLALADLIPAFNPFCVDIDGLPPSLRHGYLMVARDAVRNQSVTMCSEVSRYCYDDTPTGMKIRLVCPVSCGCARPSSKQVLSVEPAHGCPPTCTVHPEYLADVEKTNCTDLAPAQLVEYANNLKHASSVHPAKIQELWAWFAGLVMDLGCGARAVVLEAHVGATEPCSAEAFGLERYKSIRFFCPVTCGCVRGSRQCPNSCPLSSP